MNKKFARFPGRIKAAAPEKNPWRPQRFAGASLLAVLLLPSLAGLLPRNEAQPLLRLLWLPCVLAAVYLILREGHRIRGNRADHR